MKSLITFCITSSLAFIFIGGCNDQPANPNTGNTDVNLYISALERTPENIYNAVPDLVIPPVKSDLPASKSIAMPPIVDQGITRGVCWGYAGIYGTMSQLKFNGNYSSNSRKISPELFIYNAINNIAVSYPSATCAHPVVHTVKMLEFLKVYGSPTVNTSPFQTTCNTTPSSTSVNEALNYKLNYYVKAKYPSNEIIVNCKTAIATMNKPILMGMPLYQNFYDNSFSASYIHSSSTGNFRGNHSVVICGYDDSKNAFKVMNSWGTSSHSNGFFWLDYNYFKSLYIANALELYCLMY